jgi:hypothetical protein
VTVSVPAADPGSRHQLLTVYDPHRSALRLYLDGTPAASATVTSPWEGGGRLEVGQATTGDGYLFGAVDNLILWQGVPTDRQIATLADRVPRPGGPIRADEGATPPGRAAALVRRGSGPRCSRVCPVRGR